MKQGTDNRKNDIPPFPTKPYQVLELLSDGTTPRWQTSTRPLLFIATATTAATNQRSAPLLLPFLLLVGGPRPSAPPSGRPSLFLSLSLLLFSELLRCWLDLDSWENRFKSVPAERYTKQEWITRKINKQKEELHTQRKAFFAVSALWIEGKVPDCHFETLKSPPCFYLSSPSVLPGLSLLLSCHAATELCFCEPSLVERLYFVRC